MSLFGPLYFRNDNNTREEQEDYDLRMDQLRRSQIEAFKKSAWQHLTAAELLQVGVEMERLAQKILANRKL